MKFAVSVPPFGDNGMTPSDDLQTAQRLLNPISKLAPLSGLSQSTLGDSVGSGKTNGLQKLPNAFKSAFCKGRRALMVKICGSCGTYPVQQQENEIMWDFRSEDLEQSRGTQFYAYHQGKPASFDQVIRSWQSDEAFRTLYNAFLAASSFSAFRWETPPVTLSTIHRPFKFVLLDSPSIARTPDLHAFREHFEAASHAGIATFSNLGGDAILIVPSPKTTVTAYGHLAAFVREAPAAQCDALWQKIGEMMAARVSAKPVWLNTAGAGVSWLHVRLDDRPKYYGFAPYKNQDR